MSALVHLDYYVYFALWAVAVPVGLYAFIHALIQRADAFTAVDKMTKPIWLAITGVGLLVLGFTYPLGLGSPAGLLWLVGLIATLVYLLDVRPKVVEVQHPPRW